MQKIFYDTLIPALSEQLKKFSPEEICCIEIYDGDIFINLKPHLFTNENL